MIKIIKKILNFRLLIIMCFCLYNIVISNASSSENFIVTTVNKIPITKNDVLNRSKLLLFSIEKKNDFKNLENYYNQALNSLIIEKIIFSAGLKINKKIFDIITPKANKLLLNEFKNSNIKLNQFLNDLSIPKLTLLEKYKSQLVWGMVLKSKFKTQLTNLEKKVEDDFKDKKNKKTEDLYDLAEILISKKNNKILLEEIKSALNKGVNFLDLAKQVSISSSAKFKGKIGWKNYQNLPNYIKSNKIEVNEGDIISFPTKDKIKIIKILAKRLNGKFSKNEINVIIAQIKFSINFQTKDEAYNNVKYKLRSLLKDKKSCKNLNILKQKKNNNYSVNIVKSRIADLSSKIQKIVKSLELYEISKPIFFGNHGYTYVICDTKNVRQEKGTLLELKKKKMQKHYLIFSDRHLKRLYKEANIINVNNVN